MSARAVPPSTAIVDGQHIPGEDFRDGRAPQDNDTFIALMGVTGAGKSTFISQLAQRPIKIGKTLQACTQVVEVYACRFKDRTVYLIDTPGFDDTNRSDAEVLRELATWLTDSYSSSVKLDGIIYLHRISDVRMQGSAKKNLLMFKKLCGTNALQNVILATTMWNKVTLEEGADREDELKANSEFWGWMISKGSRVERHTNDRESALRLIGSFVNKGSKVTLELQHQMVNEKKTLDQTDVGLSLQTEIAKERAKFAKQLQEVREGMEEAIRLKDEESARELKEMQEQYQQTLRGFERDHEALKISMEKLHEEKYALTKHIKVQEDAHAKELQTADREKQDLLAEFKKLQIAQEPAPKPIQRKQTLMEAIVAPESKPKAPEWTVVVTLSTQQYYLAGPGGASKSKMSMPTAFASKQVKRPICVALGVSGSWIASYYRKDDSPYINSQGLDQYYPELLHQLLNRSELGVLEYVSLGSDHQYFARFERGTRYLLNPDIMSKEGISEKKSLIQHFALGASSTYVIMRKDGYRNHNLKGHYRSLGQRLDALKEGVGVKAIALDCSSTERYVLLSTTNEFRMAAESKVVEIAKSWASSNFTLRSVPTKNVKEL